MQRCGANSASQLTVLLITAHHANTGRISVECLQSIFITVSKPDSPECEINMEIMQQTCRDTGTPIEKDKFEGPATIIHFLAIGIELDTLAMEMRLPVDKLQQLRKQVHDWKGKEAVSKKETSYPLFVPFSMHVMQCTQVCPLYEG